jgi:YD repeat-containing protein
VLADPTEAPPLAETEIALPDAHDVAKGIAIAEKEEREREEVLATPAAAQEREASQKAFAAKDSPGAAAALLQDAFEEQLEVLDDDPARFLSDAKLLQPVGATAATVESGGDGQLMDGTMPIRTEDEDGNLKKVDLSLQPLEGGFETANALVDLEIGASAADEVQVGEGLSISQVGASQDSAAQRFGDDSIFFSDVGNTEILVDTDLLVAPISSGVELFSQLRSIESPETLRFHIDMPEGADLRGDGRGGAEVVKGQDTIASIPFPHAVDAQGSEVPVEMAIEGHTLLLHVAHREADVAYPLLVDPAIFEDWVNPGVRWIDGVGLAALTNGTWAYSETGSWIMESTSCIYACWGGSGRGLFVSMPSGTQWEQQFGHWYYSAPNVGSYLADAWANPFVRNDHGCSGPQYSQPHDYAGMWTPSLARWNALYPNQAAQVGSVAMGVWGEAFILGIGTGPGNTSSYMPCWRDIYVGGAVVWLDDWQSPSLNSVGATPEGWVKKDGTLRSFSVSASDAGLGIRSARMFGVGTQDWRWNMPWCAGTRSQPCAPSASGQITFTTNGFPYEGRYNGEGKERTFTVQALDPTEKTAQLQRPIWLDGTAPTVSFNDQLAIITKQVGPAEKLQNEEGDDDELSLPTYKLHIAADDGADRSGVQEIKVFLDQDPSKEPGAVPTATKPAGSCPTAGCARTLSMDYTLRPLDLAPGKHSLFIVAVDKVGNESPLDRNIVFEYIPATGMKDEYVMQHFRLPDGNDYSGEAEYHGPEIAVNVINGNVVFHQRDVDVDTDRAGIELERVYNSQQPTKQDTQWGRGWEISQAPAFEPEPEQSPVQTATMQRRGAITNAVPVPQTTGQEAFSARLRATVTKTAGGYEVEPVEADEVTAFDSNGRIQEVVLGDDSPVYLEPRSEEELEALALGAPTYASAFGSTGTANGQFKQPAGIARAADGTLWIVDSENSRVQHFSAAGAYLGKFGTAGTGNGQLDRPVDIEIDAAGNIWIANAGSDRIEKFSSTGTYLAKFGSYGSGNGQFNSPEGIAIDAKGYIWVADTRNNRIQKFTAGGSFVKAIGSAGSGQGQLLEPAGIDVGPGGGVLVADWENNRVVVFSEEGAFVRQFGIEGYGDGEFRGPVAIDVDANGDVWVSDERNERVEQFDQEGNYLAQFGAEGTGAGEMDLTYPMGIVSGPEGDLWITDSGNDRVQRWETAGVLPGGDEEKVLAPYFDPPVLDYEYENGKLEAMQLEDEATEGADPELDLVLSANKVTEVESEEAGDTTYSYGGSRLTAADGSAGETKYTYDGSERLTSVTLPNGTTATITYDETSRATSVKVDPAGPEAAKTTNFSYQAEPRRTKVWGGGNPDITYDIAEDGSVLKWAWAETPPTIASISGSLISKKGQEIEKDKDQTLFVTGNSNHQIASIKVVVNGTSVVEEKTCEDPASPPSYVCKQPPPLQWITHPSEHAAGRMDVEVIVTDFLGHQTAERFFVIVPQQPPPDPAAAPRPNFKSIKAFREDYGLDRADPKTEAQMNELVLELLYEWEGRDWTAMKAVENWGIPMRQPELSEMEWRRAYINQAAEVIPTWAEEHAPTTYGGFFVDNRAGGIIHVGFTSSQSSLVQALKSDPRLSEPSRIVEYETLPANAIVNLESLAKNATSVFAGIPAIAQSATTVRVSTDENIVRVGTTIPSTVSEVVNAHFGPAAPIVVSFQEQESFDSAGRFASKGPVVAGSALIANNAEPCTAGFGARDDAGVVRGVAQYKYFTLTAGHCYPLEELVGRQIEKFGKGIAIGKVRRSGYSGLVVTDAAAIGLLDEDLRSHSVINGDPLEAQPIQGSQGPNVTKHVCWSGVYSGKRCGMVLDHFERYFDGHLKAVYIVEGISILGDSGGPVWDGESHKAVGVITGISKELKGKCWPTSYPGVAAQGKICTRMLFTPLHAGGGSEGALPKLGLEVLKQG